MTAPAEKSSLPLLLGLTGAVLAVVGVGWFYLDSEPVSERTEPAWTLTDDSTPQDEIVADEAESEVADDASPPQPEEESNSTDTDLRKARMAASADILVLPESESALFYYNRVLEANPEDSVVLAELTAVLASIETSVEVLLAEERYDEAYDIASIVARAAPDHSLVMTTQQTLDQVASAFIDEALESARSGDDQAAVEAFRAATALPGRNPDYLAAVRSSIADIQQARAEAALDRQRRAKLRADEARQAWLTAVRRSISEGHLLTPSGASAVDLLAEDNDWSAEREQLTGEVRDALITAFEAGVLSGNLTEAEKLLKAVLELGAEAATVDEMSASLDRAYIAAEESRVSAISELNLVKRVSPRYPPTALSRGQSGWVDVYFTVTPDGDTTDITVSASEPGDLFNNAAVRAVEKWKFEPYEFKGELISKRVGTKLVFNVED